MSTRSTQPRRQRLATYTADLFERHRRMSVPLSRELRARYGRRQIPVRKGDTVRILSGSYVGREERVAKVTLREYSVTLDNVTGKAADAKLKPLSLKTSHLLLTRLNLSDPWRRRLLKVAEVPDEDDGAKAETTAPTVAEAGDAPTTPAAPKRRAAAKTSGARAARTEDAA
ncbi:MAG: 50S ribosomal protein L24 [Thermoplasmata archaeon]